MRAVGRGTILRGMLLLAIVAWASSHYASFTHGAGAWHDISVAVEPGRTPTYPGNPAIAFDWALSLDKGDIANLSDLHFGAHSGTHIDAPLHFIKGGKSIDQIPLEKLIGPARVIECSASATIVDAAELNRHLWRGARRLLFKTRNSTLNLLSDPRFHTDFTAIAPDAARLMVDDGVRLVGLDYLSIEKYGSKVPQTHLTLLGANVVVVEGLDLRGVEPGEYDLICLPVRLAGREAAPTRAVIRPR